MKALYLIDSENVGDFWIPLLDLPDEETELVVFYTKNSPHMSYDSLIKLKLSDKVVTFIKCYEGTNALDFQLVSELGYRMKGNEEGEFIIVTNDTGYDAAVKYWRKKGYSVRRITGKECKNASRSRSASRSRQRTDVQTPAQERNTPASAAVQDKKPAEEVTAREPETVTVPEESAVLVEEPAASAKEPVPESKAEEIPAAEPDETVASAPESDETAATEVTAPEPEAAQPQEETNRNAPVAEKKVWNGTGFSVVGSAAVADPEPADEKPAAEVSEQEKPQPEPSEQEEPETESSEQGEPEEAQSEPEPAAEETEQPETEETVSTPLPEAKAVATVKPAGAKRSEKKPSKKKSEEGNSIVIDDSGVSSGEAELKDLTVIVSCVGMDNLAELHNQLIQFYGQGGKQIYQSIKNGSMQIQTADWNQHEKYARYGELIFRHHGEGEKCPDDFADFIEGAGKKRDNLNSFRYALLKRYGKEKGRRYYFLLKPFMKAINEM